MAKAEEGCDEAVAVGLLEQAMARIDEDDGEVGRGGARNHVSGVLNVSRSVGDDELALGRGEIAVSHVDGDALLALGLQAVGEEAEVSAVDAFLAGGRLHGFKLVLKNAFAVVEQAPDEGALAVVDAACCCETEETVVVGGGCCCHCYVPSRVQRDGLEIPFFFTVLHGAFATLVVHASAALSNAGCGNFIDDLFEGVSVAFKGPCDGEVAEGPETDMHHFGRLFWAEVEVVGVGEDLACATDAHSVMREVE